MMNEASAVAATQNYMALPDWLIVIGYLAFVIWLGTHLAKRQTSTDHYFVADRKIPGWAAGVSMFATLLSSFTFIAFPGWTFERDWQLLMRESMSIFAVIFCAILIIPIYRQAIQMSAYEYLEKRFGYIGRFYGVVGFLTGHFLKTGVVLFTLATALAAITGMSTIHIILVLGAATIVFTFFGGIEGVVWTDVVQGILMLFSGAVVIVFLLLLLPENAFEPITVAWSGEKFKMIETEFSLTKEATWLFVAFGIFHFLTKYSTDQTMVQRYLLAPTVGDAIKGAFIGIACCFAAWITFFAIGSILWGFYQIYPERLGEDIQKADKVFPYFIGRELPIGITGVVLAGLFSSALSTISSDLNCIGACVTSDFYDRFSKNKSERSRLMVGKFSVLISGILMIGLGILMLLYPGGIVEFTMDVGAYVGAIIAGGVLALFMLGFFTRRVTTHGMYFGLVCGVAITIIALFFSENKIVTITPAISFHIWLLPIVSNIFIMIVAYLASISFFRGEPASKELTVYGYDIYSKIWTNMKELVGIKNNNTKADSEKE